MDFGDIEVRKRLEQLLSPTGLAVIPIYSFYNEFFTDQERDPWVMARQICKDDEESDLYKYCQKTAKLRNLVMHNHQYEDIIHTYKRFVKVARRLTNDMGRGVTTLKCRGIKTIMNNLIKNINEINSLMEVRAIEFEEIEPKLMPVIGTYSINYCRGHFGCNMTGCKVFIHRTNPELLTNKMESVTFLAWNGTNIKVSWNGEIKLIKKIKIVSITILELPF